MFSSEQNGKRKKAKNVPFDEIQEAANILPHMNQGKIPSDVLGSYTGMNAEGERPEQDHDDL